MLWKFEFTLCTKLELSVSTILLIAKILRPIYHIHRRIYVEICILHIWQVTFRRFDCPGASFTKPPDTRTYRM